MLIAGAVHRCRGACGLVVEAAATPSDVAERDRTRGPRRRIPMALAVKAGLGARRPRNSLEYHVHAHLDVFLNGKRVIVPAGIGINTQDPTCTRSARA